MAGISLFGVVLGVMFLALHGQAQINSGKLKFSIFGRDLKNKDRGIGLGVSDPFVEVFYTENGNAKENRIGKSNVMSDNLNPAWSNIFELDFNRAKGQTLVLRVYDEDSFSRNDNMGVAYVNVADFVDRGQSITTNVDVQGTLTLTLTSSIIPVTPASISVTPKYISAPYPQPTSPPFGAYPATTKSSFGWVTPSPHYPVHNTSGPFNSYPTSALYPYPVHTTPVFVSNYPTRGPTPFPITTKSPVVGPTQKLRFKLSASNLPNKDPFNGKSDPYVKLYFTEGGSTKKTEFGKTKVLEDNPNPQWNQVFEFTYNPTKSQKWLFEVLDKDTAGHDSLGNGEVFLSDYISKGQKVTVNLSKKEGTLTIEAA